MAIKAAYLDAKTYEAKYLRRLYEHIFKEGILHTAQFTDALKTQEKATPDMSIDVLGGDAVIDGDNTSDYGYVNLLSDITVNVAIAAADATNPRYDIILARFYDDGTVGGSYGEISVVTGTPAASPTVPTTPSNAYKLAEVLVGAGVTSITNANITDKRELANNNERGPGDIADQTFAPLGTAWGVVTSSLSAQWTAVKNGKLDARAMGTVYVTGGNLGLCYIRITLVNVTDTTYQNSKFATVHQHGIPNLDTSAFSILKSDFDLIAGKVYQLRLDAKETVSQNASLIEMHLSAKEI